MSMREYKSGVFSMLLEDAQYALDVYNALNGTGYDDTDMVEIVKLDGGVLLSVRNDASFLIDSVFNVYEHQSTYNPNMPLRFLIYFSDLMWDFVKLHDYDLYSSRRIPVPTPKFVVFYNGTVSRPAKEVFRLSDLYEHKCEEYDLELTCVVYNINPGYNDELANDSMVLHGYTAFVEKVRRYDRESNDLKEAINRAIDECIDEGILSEFFKRRRHEVEERALLDMTFERREKLIARDNRELGREEGIQQGIQEGIMHGIWQELQTVVSNMITRGMSDEDIIAITECTQDLIDKLRRA